ncbi:MAG: mechanosensitive ion channel [Pirellulaceae bacterium]
MSSVATTTANGTRYLSSPRLVELTKRIAWTLLASLKLPLVLFFVYWELRAVGEDQILAANLASGLRYMMPTWIVTMFLYRAISPNGLAVNVLSWPFGICEQLRRGLFQVLILICPILAICETMKVFSGGSYNDSLGRLVLMSAMSAMTLVVWRCASAISRFENSGSTSKIRSWLFSGRGFQYVASAIPFALVLLSAAGYRFAAEQLSIRMLWTMLGTILVALAWSTVVYLVGLFEAHTRQQLLGRDSQSRQLDLELKQNVKQVQRLINIVGFGALIVLGTSLWHTVLPLGQMLDQFPLWQGATASDGSVTAITYRHLAWSVVVVLITLGISRNLPGLIELALPNRLPLDKGGRFAVSFVSRYVVALIGMMVAANLLGFSWDRVQWLAAGLTVGLGFGLQEVFANLVSGIIILLERPVRVGDYVSVNEVSGTVTRMGAACDNDRRCGSP